MALGIVKYAYDRSSQLIGVIWFTVSCHGPQQHGNIVLARGSQTFGVMEPVKRLTIIYGAPQEFSKNKKTIACGAPRFL